MKANGIAIVFDGVSPTPTAAQITLWEAELVTKAKAWRNDPSKPGRKLLNWTQPVHARFAFDLVEEYAQDNGDQPERMRAWLHLLGNASQFAQECGFRTEGVILGAI